MKAFKINTKRIFLYSVLKTFIWIVFPLCVFGGYHSCTKYNEAGTHLTPKSVDVRGYYRKDDTYVRPYKRRPPGSVAKDAPWVRKRFWLGTLFLLCLVVGLGSCWISYFHFIDTHDEKQKQIEEIKKRRKEIHKKNHEHKRNKFKESVANYVNEIVTFNQLPEYPEKLRHSKSYKCKFRCSSNTPFFIPFRNTKYCMWIIDLEEKAVPGHPRMDYNKEIEYYKAYNKIEGRYKTIFKLKNKDSDYEFSNSEIRSLCYEHYVRSTNQRSVDHRPW